MSSELLLFFMVVSLFACLFLGYPVAFTLAGVAIIFGSLGHVFDLFYFSDFSFIPSRIFGIMNNFTLLSVPLFILMGLVLEKSKIAEDLIVSFSEILGPFRGGMAIAVILVGAVLAASTGIVGATVVTMGLLSLPSMIEAGYKKELATGVIISSGTLGQIIPPSIVLILIGDMMSLDVGDLFVGALAPGLLLVFCYVVYVMVYSFVRPEAVPLKSQAYGGKEALKRFMVSFLPPFLLLILVLGSIFIGLATPTEAAACGASVSFLMALLKRRLTFSLSKTIFWNTSKLTSMIFLLLIGAQFFAVVFRGLSGDEWIQSGISALHLSPVMVLLLILALIFFLGFFLDFIEICFIVIPIATPLLTALGFNPLWVAILFALNLQTSFLTPPFGFSLFYLKSVAPQSVKTSHIYRGIGPFLLIQLLVLFLVFFMPSFVLYLPEVIFR